VTTSEVLCARPGCGHGYTRHDTDECARPCHGGCEHGPRCRCSGFLWVPPTGPIPWHEGTPAP
jgi:hypothetical protein